METEKQKQSVEPSERLIGPQGFIPSCRMFPIQQPLTWVVSPGHQCPESAEEVEPIPIREPRSSMRPNHGGSRHVRMLPVRMSEMGRVKNQKLIIIFVCQKISESYALL